MNTALINHKDNCVEVRIFTTFLVDSVYYSTMKKYFRFIFPLNQTEIDNLIKNFKCDKTILYNAGKSATKLTKPQTILQLNLISQN